MTLLNHSSPSSFYRQYRLMDEPVEFLDEEKMKSVKKRKKDNAKEDGKVFTLQSKQVLLLKKTKKNPQTL